MLDRFHSYIVVSVQGPGRKKEFEVRVDCGDRTRKLVVGSG